MIEVKVKIEFKAERPEQWSEDTFGIRIYKNGKPGPWVHWCDPVAKRCVTSPGIQSAEGIIPVGWAGSKSQAENGAQQLQRMYDSGQIQ